MSGLTRFVTTAWADISDDGVYRYALGRNLGMVGEGRVVFVMLNPSTADAQQDDPTLRRCIGFCRSWGYAELVVCNLFAFRATRPADLRRAPDPVGPDNDEAIAHWSQNAAMVVCAWGVHGVYRERDQFVLKSLLHARKEVHTLGLTSEGHPKHPLYVPAETKPQAWAAR